MKRLWQRYRRNRASVTGLVIFAGVVAVALVGPGLYPRGPWDLVGRPFLRPFGTFPLGTDTLGRDLVAEVIAGARVSLMVALIATAIAALTGVLIGALAGYLGGGAGVLMRVIEFFQAIPSFLLALVLVAIFQPSLWSTIVAIAMASWPTLARLVRGEFIALRGREYVQACVALGVPEVKIIFRHLLPNAMSPIIVTTTLIMATAILLEAGLSFLGLGDPNLMSWGLLVAQGRTVLREAWWMSAIPGVAILLTVLSLNLVGEGLNDALNPRLHAR